jgi:hypothetical protein
VDSITRLENRLNSIHQLERIVDNQDVNTDLILMICGKRIGSGTFRDVYEFNLDPEYVVKLEKKSTSSNITEFTIWDEVRGLKGNLAWVKGWFAPIIYLSPNGKVLIMKKTEPKLNKERPNKVPAFLMDAQHDNFGWLGNKFVCHDYGFINGLISYNKRFKKVDWYEQE